MTKIILHDKDSAIVIREGGVFEIFLSGHGKTTFKAADIEGESESAPSAVIGYILANAWENEELRNTIINTAFEEDTNRIILLE